MITLQKYFWTGEAKSKILFSFTSGDIQSVILIPPPLVMVS